MPSTSVNACGRNSAHNWFTADVTAFDRAGSMRLCSRNQARPSSSVESAYRSHSFSSIAVAPGVLLVRRCVHRLGGVTGDVLGAAVEVTLAATLVLLCLTGR